MPTDPSGDVTLTHISGTAAPLREWLTTFHLAVAVLDPFEYESAWLLETAGRILTHFTGAGARVGFLMTATPDEARQFLGPWTEKLFVLCDQDKSLVKSLELETLPAFVHIGLDASLLGAAEGWDPAAWQEVANNLARSMAWSAPAIPQPGDPKPYAGASAI